MEDNLAFIAFYECLAIIKIVDVETVLLLVYTYRETLCIVLINCNDLLLSLRSKRDFKGVFDIVTLVISPNGQLTDLFSFFIMETKLVSQMGRLILNQNGSFSYDGSTRYLIPL